MPIYPIHCKACHYAGDTYARVRELDAEGRVLCPECGERAEQEYAEKAVGVGNRTFTGRTKESLLHGFAASEVPAARQAFGRDGAECIMDDGTVKFDDRKQQSKYQKRHDQLMSKDRERKQAKREAVYKSINGDT
jgi:hypothetical protein